MATEKQYNFFVYLYEQERDIQKAAVSKGQIFLSVISFYLGILIFKASDISTSVVSNDINRYVFIFYLAGVISFLLAFFANVMALGHLYKYERINSPRKIIENFGKNPPNDEDFFDDRIVDLTIAIERNSKSNNRRAKFLTLTTSLLFVGILLHLCFYITILL